MKPSSDKFIFLAVTQPYHLKKVQAKVLAICKDLKIQVKSITEEVVNSKKEVKRWYSNKPVTIDDSYYQYVVELDNPTENQWWAFHGACYGFAYGHFREKGIEDLSMNVFGQPTKRR